MRLTRMYILKIFLLLAAEVLMGSLVNRTLHYIDLTPGLKRRQSYAVNCATIFGKIHAVGFNSELSLKSGNPCYQIPM